MKAHAKAMVLASFAGDSLALGAHWIYDTTKIDEQFGRITSLLAPLDGTYHPSKIKGDFTHYGDQSFHLLEYLAAHGGNFDRDDYCHHWRTYMAQYEGYKDNATKDTLKKFEAGKDPASCGSHSTDLGGPARLAPLIYCYRENLDDLLSAVKAQTVLTHCGPGVLDGAVFLARSCYQILRGATPHEAFEQALSHKIDDAELDRRLRSCLNETHLDIRRQIKEFGQMCPIKAALPGAVYTVLKDAHSLEEALIDTVMAGGDSAARAMTVGMLLGAYHGREKIPSQWLENLNKYKLIMEYLDKLP